MKSDHRLVTVMVPGDLHLTEAGLPNHETALWAMDQANDFIRPDFVQFIGDNVQDGTDAQFDLFLALARKLQLPWCALVGDHDAHGDIRATRFVERVCHPYGAASLGGFRFLRLNTQEARPVGLGDEQLAWFREQAADAEASGEKVVIFQHNYPYQIWEDFSGPGIEDWRALVQSRPIQAIITGHTHYWQVANDGRNVFATTRSIGDPEGGPPGYTLAAFDGNDFAATYRSIEDRGPLVLITHPREAILATGPSHVVNGVDEVRALVWSTGAVQRVEFNVDQGAWTAMEYDSARWWRASLPAYRLAKGTHRLVVRVVAAQAAENAIDFAVDPTGRYTAVPVVRPVVTATQFC